jgi:hypothetical protein
MEADAVAFPKQDAAPQRLLICTHAGYHGRVLPETSVRVGFTSLIVAA